MSRRVRQNKVPRGSIAYYGDRESLGHQAANAFISNLNSRYQAMPLAKSQNKAPRDWTPPTSANQASIEQTISAVVSKRADAALVPFFSRAKGYEPETVAALSRFISVQVVDEVVATDDYCLAVPREQVMQREMASFDGAGRLSNYGPGKTPVLSAADQQRVKNLISDVFAAPSAERACSFELANYASRGARIRPIGQEASAVRSFLSSATDALDENRVVKSMFDEATGFKVENIFTGQARKQPIYGMVLPYNEAVSNDDLIIVEPKFENQDREEVRYALIKRRGLPYVEHAKGGGWPFVVKSWDGGRVAGMFGNGGSIDLSSWWRTPWRKVRGSAIIADTLRHDYRKPADLVTPENPNRRYRTLRLILAEHASGSQAPSFDDILGYARRQKYHFETATMRIGNKAPVGILELEIDDRKSHTLKPLLKKMRSGEHSLMILGGFYTDDPQLEFEGRGRTFDEAIDYALTS